VVERTTENRKVVSSILAWGKKFCYWYIDPIFC